MVFLCVLDVLIWFVGDCSRYLLRLRVFLFILRWAVWDVPWDWRYWWTSTRWFPMEWWSWLRATSGCLSSRPRWCDVWTPSIVSAGAPSPLWSLNDAISCRTRSAVQWPISTCSLPSSLDHFGTILAFPDNILYWSPTPFLKRDLYILLRSCSKTALADHDSMGLSFLSLFFYSTRWCRILLLIQTKLNTPILQTKNRSYAPIQWYRSLLLLLAKMLGN